MSDLPPLCEECGGAGVTQDGDECPKCEGWGLVLIDDDEGPEEPMGAGSGEATIEVAAEPEE